MLQFPDERLSVYVLCNLATIAPYEDVAALAGFAQAVDVITISFMVLAVLYILVTVALRAPRAPGVNMMSTFWLPPPGITMFSPAPSGATV